MNHNIFKTDTEHGRPDLVIQYGIAFFSLAVLLLLLYGNSLHGDWHLDDFDNIINNTNIHLKTLTDVNKSFQDMGKTGQGISRPLAYLSFALNYYAGGLDVFGYHVINLLIHYAAAIFLFLFIRKTLLLTIFGGRHERSAFGVALLATLLWATSPVQVTAITYIVQRMASMAGLFYIMALFFYVQGRTSHNRKKQIFLFLMCGFSALLSFGTKQNALMLPLVIIGYDLLLIQGVSREALKKNALVFGLPILLVSAFALFYLDWSKIAGDYHIRPFTMMERMLTEPRVILLYVSLLLCPLPSRLMLYHDVAWSGSLLDPWTTLIAIMTIGVVFVFALMVSKKRPLLAFCILFFILNHAIEGSFISLELVFEHRNYIPSMLFFLPFSIVAVEVLTDETTRKAIRMSVLVAIVLCLGVQFHTTYARNITFQTRIGLLKDNVAKTPNLSVVHHNLGVEYYNRREYEPAYEEYTAALALNRYLNSSQKGLTYYNLGLYYQYVKQDIDQARLYYEKAKTYTSEVDQSISLNRGDVQLPVGSGSVFIKKEVSPNGSDR